MRRLILVAMVLGFSVTSSASDDHIVNYQFGFRISVSNSSGQFMLAWLDASFDIENPTSGNAVLRNVHLHENILSSGPSGVRDYNLKDVTLFTKGGLFKKKVMIRLAKRTFIINLSSNKATFARTWSHLFPEKVPVNVKVVDGSSYSQNEDALVRALNTSKAVSLKELRSSCSYKLSSLE